MLTTAQIGAILTLLWAFGVDANIISNVSTVLHTPPHTQTIQTPSFGNISSNSPTTLSTLACIPNPSVTLTEQTANNRPYFEAIYTTGCPIPVSTSFSSSFEDSKGTEIQSGESSTISKFDEISSNASPYTGPWQHDSLPNYIPCTTTGTAVGLSCRGDAVPPIYYVFSIGGVTQKLLIN